MSNDNISEADYRAVIRQSLDEILQQGAQQLLALALEAEVASYLAKHNSQNDQGLAKVVRNGYAKETDNRRVVLVS